MNSFPHGRWIWVVRKFLQKVVLFGSTKQSSGLISQKFILTEVRWEMRPTEPFHCIIPFLQHSCTSAVNQGKDFALILFLVITECLSIKYDKDSVYRSYLSFTFLDSSEIKDQSWFLISLLNNLKSVFLKLLVLMGKWKV